MKTIQLKPIVKGRLMAVFLLFSLMAFKSQFAAGQTLYVDANKGKNNAKGTAEDPILTLEEAVAKTNVYNGNVPVTIKVKPGLYILNKRLVIKTAEVNNKQPYTIEAETLPDDKTWKPASMPVILSVSANNSNDDFPHCEGFFIAKDNVVISGLKFVGNPNAQVRNYYPIRRRDKSLSGLHVSQCYFIGEANSAPIQSSFWASGANIHVEHCIFHNSKIAFVLGNDVNDFSLTYSIIDGAYNTAIWYGFAGTQPKFTFSNNIVTNCYYVMVYPVENGQPAYTFNNSVITHNENFLGNYPKAQDKFFAEPNKHIKEINVIRTGIVKLSDVKDDGITKENLNPTLHSPGSNTKAGIFMKN